MFQEDNWTTNHKIVKVFLKEEIDFLNTWHCWSGTEDVCQLTRTLAALKKMNFKIQFFVLVVCLFAIVSAKESKSKKLQIGIKKRVENCTVKSKRGDLLHMHYAVWTIILNVERFITYLKNFLNINIRALWRMVLNLIRLTEEANHSHLP